MRTVLCLALLATLASPATAENRLAGEASPYLRQHADNPVDWYPWGPEALARARAEGKPIFVSVGYSSCHWCHVMEDESFENDAIAAFLNAHFVAIKIDREERPDLDEQFMVATQLLSGGGGWPNSVFLTPAGDPFYGGTYFPPEVFLSLLQNVAAAWRDDPAFVSSEAARASAVIGGILTQKAAAMELTPEAVAAVTADLLAQMDPFRGGLDETSKFPRESLFLFLLDRAERDGDADALAAVTDLLDAMIAGGIHDHLGGGFHRYSVDPDWDVPHFEKMLYTQAMTGRLLVRAYRLTGEARYARAARRTFDYVLRDMTGPEGGFYAAEDADSLTREGVSEEGAFYVWRTEDLSGLSAGDAELARGVFGIDGQGAIEGASVLRLEAADAGGARLDAAAEAMRGLRAERSPPFKDRKAILSWNAAMIATLAEADGALDEPRYREAAVSAARFLLDVLPGEDGLRRVWIDGHAGVPAQLPDNAALGLALVALHDTELDPASAAEWLRRARDLAAEIDARFGPADGGYRMTAARDGFTDLVPVDDTELASGNAMALMLLARLGDRMADPWVERTMHALGAALSGRAIEIPVQRGAALSALVELREGGTGPVRHAASGAVRVRLDHDRAAGRLRLDLDVAEGWHINAHEPLEDDYIATEIRLADGAGIDARYPEPVVKSLSFSGTPLALYEGRIAVEAGVPGRRANAPPPSVVLTLQACNDEICLQPEDLRFVLW